MRDPAWEGLGQSIWQGDALATLRQFPDEHFQCVVTSPPYFNLRQYSTEPVVWDEPEGGCAHAWGNWAERHDEREPDTVAGKSRTTDRFYGDESRRFDGNHQKHTASQVCARCGAMRCELGAEPDVGSYVRHVVAIFREVKRMLRPDGIAWCVIADSYSGSGGYAPDAPSNVNGSLQSRKPLAGQRVVGISPKSLCLTPERLAIALADDGWTIRSRVAWVKMAPLPESVKDRFTSAWEHVWMLTKQSIYYFDQEAARESIADPSSLTRHRDVGRGRQGYAAASGLGDHPQRDSNNGLGGSMAGRNRRNVLILPPEPTSEQHYAAFPTAIPRILLSCSVSQVGCCSHCRAPWRRCVERGEPRRVGGNAGVSVGHPWDGHGQWDAGHMPMCRATTTTGWSPACSCDAGPPVPCRVLDPFVGSGTTLLVARELGLEGWGIELSPMYVDIAARRIDTWRKVEDAADARGQASLFEVSA